MFAMFCNTFVISLIDFYVKRSLRKAMDRLYIKKGLRMQRDASTEFKAVLLHVYDKGRAKCFEFIIFGI